MGLNQPSSSSNTNLPGLIEGTEIDRNADYALIYDDSSGEHKRILLDNLIQVDDDWKPVVADYDASDGDRLIVKNGIITLPDNPTQGQSVIVMDWENDAGTNPIEVRVGTAPASQTIGNDQVGTTGSSNFFIDEDSFGFQVEFTYNAATNDWIVVQQLSNELTTVPVSVSVNTVAEMVSKNRFYELLVVDGANQPGLYHVDNAGTASPVGSGAGGGAVDSVNGKTGTVLLSQYSVVVASSDAPQLVKDFADYVCDGTDDHVEIQAAIDSLNPSFGGTVQLTAGQYNIGATLTVTIQKGFTLQGQGRGTILRANNNLNDYVITADPSSHTNGIFAGFRDFKIDGNGANQTDGGGIDMVQTLEWAVINVWFHVCHTYGLRVVAHTNNWSFAGHNSKITHCTFDEGVQSAGIGQAIYFDKSDENHIVNNTFSHMGGAGMSSDDNRACVFDQGTGLQHIAHNEFVNCHVAVRFRDGSRAIISLNIFDENRSHNLVLHNCKRCNVIGNVFYQPGNNGNAGEAIALYISFNGGGGVHSVMGNTITSHVIDGQTNWLLRDEAPAPTIYTGNVYRSEGTLSGGYVSVAVKGLMFDHKVDNTGANNELTSPMINIIPGLVADPAPNGAEDFVMVYDASADEHKKVLLDDLPGGGGGGGGILNVVEDTTPQLGGNLDVNGFTVTSSSNANVHIKPDGTGVALTEAQTWEVRDQANTRAMRVRTAGGELDWEAAGKHLFFSVWSNGDYTGSQYNQMVFFNNGDKPRFDRGAQMNGNTIENTADPVSNQDVATKKYTDDRATNGAIAPTTIPTKIGDTYVDTANSKYYFAIGTTSLADWREITLV